MAQNEDIEIALAFARGLAATMETAMRNRVAFPPEQVPQSETDVQFALVTEHGDRFNVTVAYAGSDVAQEAAAMLEP